MATYISICGDICKPMPAGGTDKENVLAATVHAPCSVATDTCERTTGDAFVGREKSRSGQNTAGADR